MELPVSSATFSRSGTLSSTDLPSYSTDNKSPIIPVEKVLHKAQSVHELPTPLPPAIPTWKPFSIPTDNDSLSSGFPYKSRLRDLRVTPDQWLQFTTEVVNAAKLTFQEDAAAWTTGVTTGTLISPLLLIFAPVAGYYAGKSVHRKTVAKKVKEKLAVEGPLRNTLRTWNEGVFMAKGIQMWLEPPTENGEVIIDAEDGLGEKEVQRRTKVMKRRFRFICLPYDPRDAPIGTDHSPISLSILTKSHWASSESLADTALENNKILEMMDGRAEPKEMDSVRPAKELMAIPRKKLTPVCSSPSGTFELHGSSAYVKE